MTASEMIAVIQGLKRGDEVTLGFSQQHNVGLKVRLAKFLELCPFVLTMQPNVWAGLHRVAHEGIWPNGERRFRAAPGPNFDPSKMILLGVESKLLESVEVVQDQPTAAPTAPPAATPAAVLAKAVTPR